MILRPSAPDRYQTNGADAEKLLKTQTLERQLSGQRAYLKSKEGTLCLDPHYLVTESVIALIVIF